METKHVVIIGAGFGGLRVAQKLAHAPMRITLIDRQNYHLFQPLLYQVAIAGLVPSQIAYPLRTIFRKQKNVTVQMGEVTAIDLEKRFVKTNGSVIAYDYLIVATGGQTNFFGMQSVEEHAHQIKDIHSAVAARNHLLKMFEQASRETDEAKRRALLAFVVVGGGPTGVETAGALGELIAHVMLKDYPHMQLADVRVLLVEASDHLMGNYPAELRKATLELLQKKHVEVMFNATVADYNGERLTFREGAQLSARTLIWTAGVKASALVNLRGVAQAGGGRARVEPTLQIPGHPEAFIIGDAAYLENGGGQPLPMLATVAQQEADAAAQNIQHLLKGEALEAFRYNDPGLLATIGRDAAVARIWGLSFSGFVAWLIWVALHIYRLIGFRNRIVVFIHWAWEYFFYDRGVRLITRE